MPEFVMNGKEDPEFKDLPMIVQGYIEAAFFTEEEDLGSEKGFADLSQEEIDSIKADCEGFLEKNRSDIDLLTGADVGYDEISAGRDLWYTRNGHGVGFWDRGFTGEVGDAADRLTEAAESIGEAYLTLDDAGDPVFEM